MEVIYPEGWLIAETHFVRAKRPTSLGQEKKVRLGYRSGYLGLAPKWTSSEFQYLPSPVKRATAELDLSSLVLIRECFGNTRSLSRALRLGW
jgi:hypothetical protein